MCHKPSAFLRPPGLILATFPIIVSVAILHLKGKSLLQLNQDVQLVEKFADFAQNSVWLLLIKSELSWDFELLEYNRLKQYETIQFPDVLLNKIQGGPKWGESSHRHWRLDLGVHLGRYSLVNPPRVGGGLNSVDNVGGQFRSGHGHRHLDPK